MVKIILSSLAALVVLAAIVGVIAFGAKSIPVSVTQERYQTCLDSAEAKHKPPINCPKIETLWDRGFEDPVAYYTFWLALFTVALALGALVQSILVGRQIALSRDEFLASHRPRIRVRAVGFDGEPDDINNFQIALTCVNIGETECEILFVRYWVSAVKFPDKPNRVAGSFKQMDIVPPVMLDPGEPELFVSESLALPIECAKTGFDVFGFVQYEDKRGIKRLTGFWRRYRTNTESFAAPENPDWNYEY